MVGSWRVRTPLADGARTGENATGYTICNLERMTHDLHAAAGHGQD